MSATAATSNDYHSLILHAWRDLGGLHGTVRTTDIAARLGLPVYLVDYHWRQIVATVAHRMQQRQNVATWKEA